MKTTLNRVQGFAGFVYWDVRMRVLRGNASEIEITVVVTRKVWGGNRPEQGAHTQCVLVSILQTCRQRYRSATAFLEKLLHLPEPQALELTPPCTR